MHYTVNFTPQAVEDLSRLDKMVAQNIANKIDWLSKNVENISPAPLKGRFKDKYKLRIGGWRVIYSFNHASRTITVYVIKHRSEVYKI